MNVETGRTDADGFKRAEATMRVVITLFVLLDFALFGLMVTR